MMPPEPQPKSLKRKRDTTPASAPATPPTVAPQTLTSPLRSTPIHAAGQYRTRNRERDRLAKQAGVKIVGAPWHQKSADDQVMQSEHAYGHKALIGEELKRGERGASRKVEDDAPAYYEQYDMHRAHPGTGSGAVESEVEGSPSKKARYSADEYREDQRGLLLQTARGEKSGGASAAMQLNQAEYAFIPGFRTHGRTPSTGETLADDSYRNMVENHPPVPVYEAGTIHQVGVDDDDRMEMEAARIIARGGGLGPNRYLSPEQLASLRERWGTWS